MFSRFLKAILPFLQILSHYLAQHSFINRMYLDFAIFGINSNIGVLKIQPYLKLNLLPKDFNLLLLSLAQLSVSSYMVCMFCIIFFY